MTRTLLVGPWVGEFGFEVALWAPHARFIARDFDHVTVACEPGHEALYEDFAHEFELFPVPEAVVLRDCEYGHTTPNNGDSAPRLELPPLRVADHWLHPYRLREVMSWPWGSMPFMPEGRSVPLKALHRTPKRNHIVAIHARSAFKQSLKSWSPQKWNELARVMFDDVTEILAIGTQVHDLDVRVTDCRGSDLRATRAVLAMADVLVGPSSGPMAFASHCGVPCVWWADHGQPAELLYAQDGEVAACWNPHRIQHWRAADTWDPSVDEVLLAVQASLS